jgi:hypothetical protein
MPVLYLLGFLASNSEMPITVFQRENDRKEEVQGGFKSLAGEEAYLSDALRNAAKDSCL